MDTELATIDRRTRSDADIRPVDPGAFVDDELPALIDANGPLAAAGMARLGLRPLAIDVAGEQRTLRAEGPTLVAEKGVADDAMAIELTPEQLTDWVHEVRSTVGFFTMRDAPLRNGKAGEFVAWEVVMRALLEGRRPHEPHSITFTGLDGAPLDLERAFTPDDDDVEIAHYLREAGFLRLRGWFDPADMARIADDMDAALPTYTKDDGRSWWATLSNGDDTCVRMQHFVEHSETTADMLRSERWDRVRRACEGPDTLVQAPVEGNAIEALVKPLGVVQGISDIPWHKDCAMGRHGFHCCGVTVGVSVTDGQADSGQLRVVAGSHRASVPASGLRRDMDLPVIALPTQAGDLTVHLSCTLHEAQPPVSRPRKVMYSGFKLPARGERTARDDEAWRMRNAAHKITSQPASPTAAR